MIPNSGQATIHILGVGLLHMDHDSLDLVTPDLEDPKTHKNLLRVVQNAFLQVDETHITVREAIEKLPEQFGVPRSALTVIEISDEGPIEPSTEDKTF